MQNDAVLVDLYDTLAWSGWGKWQRTFAEHLGEDEATIIRAFDDTRAARSVGAYGSAAGDVIAVLDALGRGHTPALVDELLELEDDGILSDIHLYDDSLPVVRELRARGTATALISNCSHNTRPVVDRLGLEEAFDAVILSFEVGAAKPQPEIYLAALERVGTTADRSIFVDDQPTYCDGAAELGIATRLILRPNEDVPDDTNGHRVITSLSALLD